MYVNLSATKFFSVLLGVVLTTAIAHAEFKKSTIPRPFKLVAVSPSGKTLALVNHQGQRLPIVELWDFTTRKKLRDCSFEGDRGSFQVAFSADGEYVAATLYEGDPNETEIAVWEVATGKLVSSTEPMSVMSMAFGPKSIYFSRGDEKGIQILDPTNGKVTGTLKSKGDEWLLNVAYLPEIDKVVAADTDAGVIVAFDPKTNSEVQRVKVRIKSGFHQRGAFAPSGMLLALVSNSGEVSVVNGKDEVLPEIPGANYGAIAFAPGTSLVALSKQGDNQDLILWDCVAGKHSVIEKKINYAPDLTWTPDGKTLIAAGYLELRFYTSDEPLGEGTPAVETDAVASPPAPKKEFRVWTSADGKYRVEALLIGTEGGNVVLQRKDNGKQVSVPMNRLSRADQLHVQAN